MADHATSFDCDEKRMRLIFVENELFRGIAWKLSGKSLIPVLKCLKYVVSW